jgi:parallel beta-helix repeat protein
VVSIVGNTIRGNQACGVRWSCGGGIDLVYARAPGLVQDNLISSNVLSMGEGFGGGLNLFETHGLLLAQNRCEGNEGAAWGGGMSVLGSITTSIERNTFSNNGVDSSGGGIYLEEATSTSTVDGNLFKGNSAKYGGAVLSYGSKNTATIIITNNVLVKNRAYWGGALFDVHDSPQNHPTQIVNNTMWANHADIGGALALYTARAALVNTICWGNTAGHGREIQMWGGSLTIAHSDISGGRDSIAIDSAAAVDTLENIDTDPAFADSTMTLADSSWCIGAGIDSMRIGSIVIHAPATCFGGVRRPYPPGSSPDIGACESPLATPTTTVAISPGLLPLTFWLDQNYPNPFNPTTVISYHVPVKAYVRLAVYDCIGREVTVLVEEGKAPGTYSVRFDGSILASGIYLYRLEAGGSIQTRTMGLIR